MRLRTLPLSLAGIIMGVSIAASCGGVDGLTVVLLILTTVSLQILSNLSNELGDTLHGTDVSEERLGMRYSLMDGGLGISDIKKLIIGSAVACVLSGTAMIWRSFGTLLGLWPIAFLIFGALAVWAAMNYTLGSKPYGYRGLGDIAVFIFFGMATVIGGCFICSHNFGSWRILLPAAAIGFFSVGVLNVNNIRDMKTDSATRVTVAIKLGERRSRIYQTILVTLGWLSMMVYTLISQHSSWLYVITLPLYVLHVIGVWKRHDRELDKMLPLLVISTFLFAALAGIGMLK